MQIYLHTEARMASKHENGVDSVNGHKQDQPGALRVLIVGAGIAGLSTAIGLRQQGHHVQVWKMGTFNSRITDCEQDF